LALPPAATWIRSGEAATGPGCVGRGAAPQGFANNGQATGAAATLQGIAPGNCVVTATINGQTATLNVTVTQTPDANVTGVAIGLSS
jgi:hypothetical protein